MSSSHVGVEAPERSGLAATVTSPMPDTDRQSPAASARSWRQSSLLEPASHARGDVRRMSSAPESTSYGREHRSSTARTAASAVPPEATAKGAGQRSRESAQRALPSW